jgi:hypothetical protein
MKRLKMNTRHCFSIFLLSALLFVVQGCAMTKPQPVDPSAYKNRTKSSVNGDVAVAVAVPTIAEAQAIFGVELASKYIQPVWVEIKNGSTAPYWFLPSGLDPNYFSPSEAAFTFRTGSDDANRQLDEKFRKLQFQNPIRPGSTEAGFILVNIDEGFKAIDIDLISREDVKSFSFIIVDPDFKADYKLVDFNTLYAAEEIINIEDEKELRRVLEELPCCTTNANGGEYGDPLNLIIIGDTNDIVPALVRRGWHATEIIWSRAILRTIKSFLQGERYRYSPISPLNVYSRRQDIGW